jgi:ABC-2 type transport system permease protein
LGVSALFIALTLSRLQAQKKSFKKRMIAFGQILLWIILVNFTASFMFVRLDLTTEKRFTLHQNTRYMLRNLDDVVYFKIYLDGDLPPGFRRLRNATREMLEEFRARNNRVQFEFVNLHNIKDEIERGRKSFELMQKGITNTNVEIRERGGATSRRTIFTAAEVTFQGRTEIVELLQSQVGLSSEEVLNNSIQTLEYQLMSTIYKLTQSNKKRVAFVHGHGQANDLESHSAFVALQGLY